MRRWERLFADLEAQAHDLELDERDALVDDLRDGDWAQTSWRDLLGGRVTLLVQGGHRVDGAVTLINEQLIQVQGDGRDHIVSTAAVITVLSSERRAESSSAVGDAISWGHAFRAMRDEGAEVRVHLVDGTSRDGSVLVAGRDFARLRADSGHDQLVPFAAIAIVSGRT